MFLKFINRKLELNFLEKVYKEKGFSFFVIYGRRRVGKTELIKEFIKDKKNIYFLCDKGGTLRNMIRFKKTISQFLSEPIIETVDPEEIFLYLTKKIHEKTVVVFDEFSYLVEKDDSIPSIFQVIIDEILKEKNIMLIFCGSSMSMMEEGVLSRKSPLYGRKSAHLKLLPITFEHLKDFFPKNNFEKNVKFYSVLGGVPFYLIKFSDELDIYNNIKTQILSKEGKLYEEVDFLLREELREPDIYKSILLAIASGSTKLVEISNKSKIRVQDLDKYLKKLINLGFVSREIPITEQKSKKALYFINDNFFNFWFSFCEPYKSDIMIGKIKNAEIELRNKFNIFVSKTFEKLIREEIISKNLDFQKIGRWWGHYRENNIRKEVEIDIVALNEEKKEILFAECKWKDNVNAPQVLAELKEKAKYVDWNNDNRKEQYAIFAKSFKKKADCYCFDLKDIENRFKK